MREPGEAKVSEFCIGEGKEVRFVRKVRFWIKGVN